MNTTRTIVIVALFGCLLVSGQEAKSDRSVYALGTDDQISIRALNMPDISDKPLRIDADGYIKLPMIGRVKAAGLTLPRLESDLVERLKVYLENPDVVVAVTEFHSQPVSIVGEVRTPGVHQIQGSKTLIEILALAGGLHPEAGPIVRITRRLEYSRIPLPRATD